MTHSELIYMINRMTLKELETVRELIDIKIKLKIIKAHKQILKIKRPD